MTTIAGRTPRIARRTIVLSVNWLASFSLVQAVAVAWVLSQQRTVVFDGRASGHTHHGAGGTHYAPPISLERAPYLAGITFLTAHILFVLLAASAYVLRKTLVRIGKQVPSLPVHLAFAGLATVVTTVATPVVAWISLGEQPSATVVAEAVDAARAAFVISVLFIALFGMPWPRRPDRPAD
ncbi:hypothetical protein ALI144C_09565 [Actinosynnema sp. ALI-1.44]|uniref:hypothetical protein n=1 Tax=Actinosynnema sp. ALI-1.44 TaxID=1933779 RepID=UPI00097BE331|nr:hypothetical protein [Actinosynnema sp. ALI-1.44]ONI86898.1 hypothetical protein ALI144C_09565 [Actinosynnema sp. ALI-1.44]